jgi:hypothetical protein
VSRAARIFLAIAVLWAGLWAMGSAGFFHGARGFDAEAERVGAPLTGLGGANDARVEGVVGEGPEVLGPLTQQPCAAAVATATRVTSWEDSQEKTQSQHRLVARRAVPAVVTVVVNNAPVEVPIAAWVPPPSKSGDTVQAAQELPAALQVTEAELSQSTDGARGVFAQFTLEEWRLMKGERVTLLGRFQEREGGVLVLTPSQSGKTELMRGSQAEVVAAFRDHARGLRIAGVVFAVLAISPLLGFAVVMRRRRSS